MRHETFQFLEGYASEKSSEPVLGFMLELHVQFNVVGTVVIRTKNELRMTFVRDRPHVDHLLHLSPAIIYY